MHILIEVDVQHACFVLAADHKRLVKSFKVVVIETLAPLTKQPPDPFIHCVRFLPISLMHLLPSIMLWHETGTLQDLKPHIITQIWPDTNIKCPVCKRIYASRRKLSFLSVHVHKGEGEVAYIWNHAWFVQTTDNCTGSSVRQTFTRFKSQNLKHTIIQLKVSEIPWAQNDSYGKH